MGLLLQSEISLGADIVTEGHHAFCQVPLEILWSHDVVVVVEKNNMVSVCEEGEDHRDWGGSRELEGRWVNEVRQEHPRLTNLGEGGVVVCRPESNG